MDNFKKEREAVLVLREAVLVLREAALCLRAQAYCYVVFGWAMCAAAFVWLMARDPTSPVSNPVWLAIWGFVAGSFGCRRFVLYQRIISRLPTDRTR